MFSNEGSAGVAGNRRTPPRLGMLLLAVTNTAFEKCWRRVLGLTPAAAVAAAAGVLLGTIREILAGVNCKVVLVAA